VQHFSTPSDRLIEEFKIFLQAYFLAKICSVIHPDQRKVDWGFVQKSKRMVKCELFYETKYYS
jgi:hypothetical protein